MSTATTTAPATGKAIKNTKLKRTTFTTSRLMEFCSEKELVNQTGHSSYYWPLVVLKELLDNSLDACEEADISPAIKVKVSAKGITVADNGPGIPDKTVEGILDYSIRVSSREAYVAPDRGAQGNALKTILAMPFVLCCDDDEDTDDESVRFTKDRRGRVDISAAGKRHEIVFSVDPIRQEPKIERTVRPAPNVKNGTIFTIHWRNIASNILTDQKDDFLQLASDFTFLNPHLTISVDWFGEKTTTKATDPGWRKWKPNMPTSAHWYGLEDMERLIAAYLTHDQDQGTSRYVRDLVTHLKLAVDVWRHGLKSSETDLRHHLAKAMNQHDTFHATHQRRVPCISWQRSSKEVTVRLIVTKFVFAGDQRLQLGLLDRLLIFHRLAASNLDFLKDVIIGIVFQNFVDFRLLSLVLQHLDVFDFANEVPNSFYCFPQTFVAIRQRNDTH